MKCELELSRMEYRPVKYQYLGFGEFKAAHRFCKAVDEVSLSEEEKKIIKGVHEIEKIFQAA